MKSKFLVLLTIVAVICWAVVAFPFGAQASGLLYLDDGGGNTATIADQGVGDLNPVVGAITFIGALGPVWNLNVTTGLSLNPIPIVDLNSIDTSIDAGTLTLIYTDGPFQVGTSAIMEIGGTAAGKIGDLAAFDSVVIHTFIGLGPGAFSDTFSGPIAPINPTTLTEFVQITHTGAGVTSFNASLNTVPLPPTAMLLGSGLLGLVGLRWRRKKSQ
jgi:hypothetical protein